MEKLKRILFILLIVIAILVIAFIVYAFICKIHLQVETEHYLHMQRHLIDSIYNNL